MAEPQPKSALTSVADAQARIAAMVSPRPVISMPLSQALGRVLAAPLISKRTQPPLDVSAMDGYAVRCADLTSLPCTLQVTGAIAAGTMPGEIVGAGQAIRIFTGAAIPRGADMVVIQENTHRSGDRLTVLEATPAAGLNIRMAGGDFHAGEALLDAPRRLTPRDIALAAAMDHASLPVYRQPKAALLATGDELTFPGAARQPSQIVASSLFGLEAQLKSWGLEPIPLPLTPDDPGLIRDRIEQARDRENADIIITLGGASVGDHDHMLRVLKDLNADIAVLKVAMRPGKPMMAARLGDTTVLALPGNPVSAMVCAMLFLRTAVHAMECDPGPVVSLTSVQLGAPLPANDLRQDYIRARLTGGKAVPFPVQDSGQLRPLASADCLIVRPPFAPACAPGDTVQVCLLQ